MNQSHIAYFSMEIALEEGMPTYSGGLGVLAGDMIRSAADLQIPMVAVTLLYRKGYFYQHLDAAGWQSEEPAQWNPEDFLEELPARVTVEIEGRNVQLRAWRYDVEGISGHKVPVFLLDADLSENTEQDRALTHFLYGGDQRYRLCQEVVLGRGGVRMLHALGYENIERFHMNEGHAALLTLELLDEEIAGAGRASLSRADIEAVRAKCVFTTHTPVPAGHDQFPLDLVTSVVGPRQDFLDFQDAFTMELMNRVFREHRAFAGMQDLVHSGLTLNMTYMALNCSRYVNGVAKKHGGLRA
jgi:starch phosphorylase